MELPDFQQYRDRFTQKGFMEKISRVAKRAGAKLVYAALILYYTLESDTISLKEKAIIVGALGYLISPLDMVPDAIPIAGLGDDLAVLVYVVGMVWSNVSEEVKTKARNKLSTWFDEDELTGADDLFRNFFPKASVILFQLPCNIAPAALEQCYRIAVRLLQGCWRKFTAASVNDKRERATFSLLPHRHFTWCRYYSNSSKYLTIFSRIG